MSSALALADARVSDREAEVLALLGEHLSHAEIAGRLFISVRTVESHVASLRRKLGAAGRRELIRLAVGYRAAAAERASAPTARMPSPLTSFVGRTVERAALAGALGQSRLVSAVGPGGAGKTRLALAVAAEVSDWFPSGAWYVDLVQVADPAMLPAAVIAGIGEAESSGRSAVDVLVARVAGRRALLVLDNCEHLVNAVAVIVERLLSDCPNLAVLVTSRVRLAVPHETVYLVPGLSVGPGDGGDAVVLFAERAASAGAPVQDRAARRRAAGICRALGGMPLAIELAAARLPSLGMDGLEAGLADQLLLLAGGARQQQRHRSMTDTLDWSYQLLDPRDRAVLRRVAVFASPFSAFAATTVAGFDPVSPGEVGDALARLAEHSLLAPVSWTGGTRYRALEPVRQFGAARLDADSDQRARHRHLAWCLNAARDLDKRDPAGATWCRALDTVVDDLRAALGWAAAQQGTRDDAHQLAESLAHLLFSRGGLREAQHRYEQAAALADGPSRAAAALECAAAVAKCRTLGEEAQRLDLAAADAHLRADDRAAAAVAFARCAEHVSRHVGMFAGKPAAATAETLIAEARTHAGGDVRARAAVTNAEAYNADPASGQGASLASHSLSLARQADDPLLISAALDAVALEHVHRGDIETAASISASRIDALIVLARDPRAAFELKDALHTSVVTGVAAGQIAPSLRQAEQGDSLPFVRQEPDLSCEDLIPPVTLASQWDRVIALGGQFRRSWEQAGRPVAPGRALVPAAIAMVHGLRGDDVSRAQWLGILAALCGTSEAQAVHGSGCGEAFEAIVLLHRGQADAALDLLTASTTRSREWLPRLWHQWTVALRAESAVLARHPAARQSVDSAASSATGNPIAGAIVRRADALLTGDRAALLATASAFTDAAYPYQRARTLMMAGGEERSTGCAELAAMKAEPMALSM